MSAVTAPVDGAATFARDSRTRLALAALVLTATGAVLGLPYAPGGATLVFVVAALGAFGTRAGVLLGALALVAGLGTVPVYQPTLMLPAIGMGLAGLGLGLLGRELDRLARVLPSTLVAGALIAVVAAATMALPEGRVLLADGAGAPLALPALWVDGSSFLRVATEIPAYVTRPNPGGSLSAIALLATLLAALLIVIVHLRGGDPSSPSAGEARVPARERRAAWELAALAGALALIVALLGLGQLAFDMGPSALEPEAWRNALDLAGSRDGAVIDLAVPPSMGLRLWSRPWIDGLRLLPALGLLWLAVRELRAKTPVRVASFAPHGLSPLTPCALAVTAAGTALIAAAHGLQGAPLALIAGLVLGLGAVVAGRTWTEVPSALGVVEVGPAVPALAPLLALAGSAFVWVFAWLVTPLFGA